MGYVLIYFPFIFIIAWPLDAIWRYYKPPAEQQNFYYYRSFWVIFVIVILLILFTDILITVKNIH